MNLHCWLLKGGKVGLSKHWSIYYAWKLKLFWLSHCQLSNLMTWLQLPTWEWTQYVPGNAHPLHGCFFSPPLPTAQTRAPARMGLWLTPYGSSFALFQSNRAMTRAGSAAWSANFFFFWWGQFPLASKHLLESSLNKCLVKRLVLW